MTILFADDTTLIVTDKSIDGLDTAAASGGEYSITDDDRVRPKHVLIEFEK
jgi:hypothetical protein